MPLKISTCGKTSPRPPTSEVKPIPNSTQRICNFEECELAWSDDSKTWGKQKGEKGFPGSSVGKDPAGNSGDARYMGSIPGLGRSPGGGHSNPLQYSCLENSMDRGAWGLSSGLQRVGHDWSDLACTHASNQIIHSGHGESREQRKRCHGQWPNISLLKTH